MPSKQNYYKSRYCKVQKEIIEYVVFYEFCKLKISKTSKKFYETLKKYMPNYENYEFELVGVQY